MYIHVYTYYVNVYVCVYVYTCTYTPYVCGIICTCAYIYVHTLDICMCVHVCIYTSLYIPSLLTDEGITQAATKLHTCGARTEQQVGPGC